MAEIPVRECPRTSENFCRRFRTFADWGCPRKSAKVHKSRECPRKIKKVCGTLVILSISTVKLLSGGHWWTSAYWKFTVRQYTTEELLPPKVRVYMYTVYGHRVCGGNSAATEFLHRKICKCPRPRTDCGRKSATVRGCEYDNPRRKSTN